MALARLLSLVERGGHAGRGPRPACAYRSGAEARTVGITGAPGAGKSTLVDRLITVARGRGARARRAGRRPHVAVLRRGDPRRPGPHAGPRPRRRRLHPVDGDPGPSRRAGPGRARGDPGPRHRRPARSSLVETVGVGQVEVEVAAATDTTVVVVNPRWGDAVQANKAGLLEIADVFVINKADMPGAAETAPRPRADARPVRRQRLAPAGRRDGGRDRRGRRRPVGRGHAATGAELAADGTLARRRRERLERELRQVLAARIEDEIRHLTGGEEFAAAVARRRRAPPRPLRGGRPADPGGRPTGPEDTPTRPHSQGTSGTVRPWPTRGQRAGAAADRCGGRSDEPRRASRPRTSSRAPSPGSAPGRPAAARHPARRALPAPGDRDWYRRAVFYEVLDPGLLRRQRRRDRRHRRPAGQARLPRVARDRLPLAPALLPLARCATAATTSATSSRSTPTSAPSTTSARSSTTPTAARSGSSPTWS